ncbi:hypothetical protein N8T08_000811 [Aspergillus melleus]|uniref:Uncharacterized protein n=1 Tax=Aspergillus melleus TaxID=138277 RepID=A0ACC3AP46_9EURO|nr:hypothetical protein N8T08_000811 [Aspergillus melleus]
MHLPTVLLTLTTAVGLAAADSYFCRPAQDKSGFLQKAYCCTTFIDVPGNDVGKISEGCTKMGEDVRELCDDGNTPKCCYTIGPKVICTAEATPQFGLDG